MDSFEKDKIARNAQGTPLGRIVLNDDEPYVKGENILVVTLTVPNEVGAHLGSTYYVDGIAYKIPKDLPAVKLTKYRNRWVADNFILERVE